MCIKSIEVINFKSFDNLSVNFDNFNILIGANASGKSNFIQIFRFLRDITNYGLTNAISIQGGNEYITNINTGFSKDLSIKIVTDESIRFARKKGNAYYGIRSKEITYDFVIKFDKTGKGFKISRDKIKLRCGFFELAREKNKFQEKKEIAEKNITIENDEGNLIYKLDRPRELPLKAVDIFPPSFIRNRLPRQTLIIEIPTFTFITPAETIFSEIPIYDFDPKLPKKAVPFTAKSDLEEDGSNLAIVLKNILEDEEKKRKLMNILSDFLPFIDNLRIEKFAGKYLIFTVCETYSKDSYLPASIMSDGTINITSLIIALYFEENKCVIIEEPERNIHPHLISKVVNMFKETSKDKQIIVTTHNPEVVKYANMEDLLLISRDADGFSYVTKPNDKKEIKIFLENQIGIDELFVQNLLE